MRQNGTALAEVLAPESESGVRAKMAQDDPVRAALRLAPRLVLTEAESAEWDEAERSVTHWIPHHEAMAVLRRGEDL